MTCIIFLAYSNLFLSRSSRNGSSGCCWKFWNPLAQTRVTSILIVSLCLPLPLTQLPLSDFKTIKQIVPLLHSEPSTGLDFTQSKILSLYHAGFPMVWSISHDLHVPFLQASVVSCHYGSWPSCSSLKYQAHSCTWTLALAIPCTRNIFPLDRHTFPLPHLLRVLAQVLPSQGA